MDPRIVEFSLALSDSDRISDERQKGILRDVMNNLLPVDVVNNSVKSGFTNDIRIVADIFTPQLLENNFKKEIEIIGINKKEYIKIYNNFLKSREWNDANIINKIGALLCWVQVFKVKE